jgi:hypothetical protein
LRRSLPAPSSAPSLAALLSLLSSPRHIITVEEIGTTTVIVTDTTMTTVPSHRHSNSILLHIQHMKAVDTIRLSTSSREGMTLLHGMMSERGIVVVDPGEETVVTEDTHLHRTNADTE